MNHAIETYLSYPRPRRAGTAGDQAIWFAVVTDLATGTPLYVAGPCASQQAAHAAAAAWAAEHAIDPAAQ